MEKSEGVGSGRGCALPSWGSGACPRKKNQFCAKNYAILSKYWYFFPLLQHKNFQHAKIVTSASEKVGDYPPVLKVGDLSPAPPPAPMPMTTINDDASTLTDLQYCNDSWCTEGMAPPSLHYKQQNNRIRNPALNFH